MQRGVITISREESQELLNLIPEAQNQTPLFNKVNAATMTQDAEVGLQLSEEEAEIILDNVGIPESMEPAQRSSLRSKMQQFLMRLRQTSKQNY